MNGIWGNFCYWKRESRSLEWLESQAASRRLPKYLFHLFWIFKATNLAVLKATLNWSLTGFSKCLLFQEDRFLLEIGSSKTTDTRAERIYVNTHDCHANIVTPQGVTHARQEFNMHMAPVIVQRVTFVKPYNIKTWLVITKIVCES